MSLADVVRGAVATVDTVVKSLEEDVTISRRTWSDGYGGPATSDVVVRAIVEQKVGLHQMADGRMVLAKAKLTILQVVEPEGSEGRVEPIDPRDVITLADGTRGKVIDVSGFRDPALARPFFLEIWLG